MAKRFIKVGNVMKKRDGSGVFITLGNSKAKNEKYRYSVELTVRDSTGKVVGTSRDCLLSISDPRSRPGITEEESARIPDSIKNELTLVIEE
jgi:hypothetical protein